MTHDFIINTENVNEYKYRILTGGIDYSQYMRNPVVLHMHDRYDDENKGSEVIGKCIKLFVEGTQLIATIEFDEADDFGKKIAGKVERGFLRMASMYADVVEASSSPEFIIPGQVYETVTKCKLVEISIVDIGGNDDALKLSKGANLKLNKIKTENNMSKLMTIALALSLAADTTEDVVVGEVQKLKLAKEDADKNVIKLQNELKSIRTNESDIIVNEAVKLGLIPEALKPSTLAAFENDFEGQKAILNKLIDDAKTANGLGADNEKIKSVTLAAKDSKGVDIPEQSFDYLQKHDVVKLSKIRKEQPEVYEKMAQDYASGTRYNEKK